MINAPILTEFPVDHCAPNGGNVAGIAVMEVARVQDIYSMPACSCKDGGPVTGSIFLKPGTSFIRYEFDDDGLFWKMDEVESPHLSYYRHTIQGVRSKVTPELMTALMRLRLGRFIVRLTDYNGFAWLIGTLSTPVTFLGSTEIGAERAGVNQGLFRFLCIQKRAACAHDGQIAVISCDGIENDDFNTFGFIYNASGQFTSITAPTLSTGSVVGSIVSYDDGTIQQLTGGAYADTLTETGGTYTADGGAALLTPGTYRVTLPMSVTLVDGTACAFNLQYILSYSYGCGDVAASDFKLVQFNFDGSGNFTGFATPTPDPAGIVALVTGVDDGTIQQISGPGSYVDGITETGGIYEPDGGPVLLSNGVYRVTMPVSITLKNQQTCAFTLVQDISVGINIFDPSKFDPSIFA